MSKIIYQLGKNLAKIMSHKPFIRMPSAFKLPREIITSTKIILIYLTTFRKQQLPTTMQVVSQRNVLIMTCKMI